MISVHRYTGIMDEPGYRNKNRLLNKSRYKITYKTTSLSLLFARPDPLVSSVIQVIPELFLPD